MDLQVILGRRLAHFREAKGLSQLQLAKAVKISSQYLGRLEAGERAPSFAVFDRLAKALQVNAGLLLMDDDFKGTPKGELMPVGISQLQGAASRLTSDDLELVLSLVRRLGKAKGR